MKHRAIAKVVVESSGALLVYPQTEKNFSYEHIYREASGLRWDRERRALYAYEPSRWGHDELLRHMAATLREAFEEQLVFTEETTWVGVLPELQGRLRRAVGQGV